MVRREGSTGTTKERNKVALYAHAGSGNHGCEALANTICRLLGSPVRLVTNSAEEDNQYTLKGLCEIQPERKIRDNRMAHIFYYGWRMLTGDKESFQRYRFRNVLGKNACTWNISIGGDNYCYENMIRDLILANSLFNRQGRNTILLGCSIEPELLEREDIRQDMNRYAAIFARESLTYEALERAGITTQLYLYPDSAFILDTKKLPLPAGFQKGNTLGINISPMIVENEENSGITMQNYRALIRYVLDHTDMSVALIPHVVWERNDDRKTLAELYSYFENERRVLLIGDHSCEELKGYISECRFFVGARTHATIAAYSSQVPTLVVGYSVKAKGIARDLFGTYENYVIPVQSLREEGELIKAFNRMLEQEEKLKEQLARVMPPYIERVYKLGDKLKEIVG